MEYNMNKFKNHPNYDNEPECVEIIEATYDNLIFTINDTVYALDRKLSFVMFECYHINNGIYCISIKLDTCIINWYYNTPSMTHIVEPQN